MRATESPKVAEQMRKLSQVPIDRIRKFPAVVVDVPIGDLSFKNSHRAVYVLGFTLLQARDQANKLANVYQQVENNLKTLIENIENRKWEDDTDENKILEELKKAISPEVVKEQLEARIKAFEEKQKEKIEHD